jgi:hypothetical protein
MTATTTSNSMSVKARQLIFDERREEIGDLCRNLVSFPSNGFIHLKTIASIPLTYALS